MPIVPFLAARIVFALAVFAAVTVAITSRPTKRLIDFDQSFYLTIAYDLERYGVFSNGVFDAVDSTASTPPPGMFFSPLYPWVVVGAMKIDPRFAQAVMCSIEADHHKRDLAACDLYARPIHLIHALLLTVGVLAIALAAEAIFSSTRLFYGVGILATLGVAAESELFSYIMTESLWLSLYSASMLAVVTGLKTTRTWVFLVAGLLLGALCLARASFLALAPVLIGIVLIYARRFSSLGMRAWIRNLAALALGVLVLVIPWVARNYVSIGRAGFSEEYGSAALVERFAFNDMTPREFALAFPYCVPAAGPAVVGRLFGADVVDRFEWNRPGSFFESGRARRTQLVAAKGRLDPIIGEVMREEWRRNWWRHLLTSVPLGWCGLWVGGMWSLFVLPLFAWACIEALRRSKPLFLFYALPPLALVGLHAAVANHYSRYNLGLIGPMAAGGAWVISLLLRGRSSAPAM